MDTIPFHRCDDTHDAAAQAVEAIAARLAPRGLQLTGPDALRDLLAAALRLATVEEVIADPTALAFALQEELNDLEEARLNGAEVAPREVLDLEARLEAALAAEAAQAPVLEEAF